MTESLTMRKIYSLGLLQKEYIYIDKNIYIGISHSYLHVLYGLMRSQYLQNCFSN